MKWWRLAAEQGDALAQSSVGSMYAEGRGVPQDDAEAVKWFRLAAERGRPTAQVFLSFMYSEGRGVPQDYTLAHMWCNLAASRISGDEREAAARLRELRDRLAESMTPAQVAEAQRLAREWKPKSWDELER